ncbi:hypothetical protein D3C75_1241150 [compost metagenome]
MQRERRIPAAVGAGSSGIPTTSTLPEYPGGSANVATTAGMLFRAASAGLFPLQQTQLHAGD